MKLLSKIGACLSRRRLAVLLFILTIATAIFVILTGPSGRFTHARDAVSWQAIDTILHEQYADVRGMKTQQLADWLNDRERVRPLLLDVREPAEYAVSHLPGAENVTVQKLDTVATDKSQAIVVYCSVGLRSVAAARRLAAAGYKNVFNLEGSIFQWANEDRALEGGQYVHPYNVLWGTLLLPRKNAATATRH